MTTANAARVEFGDFQTPITLAREVCRAIERLGINPSSILEPTCGKGSFIQAAIATFPALTTIVGNEINPQYASKARSVTCNKSGHIRADIIENDFFTLDLDSVMRPLPDPVLILGNPPWVTNSGLGVLKSSNVPTKSNVNRARGIEALTGSSNFDISEWILRKCLQYLSLRSGTLAVLCKTAVARKVMNFVWNAEYPVMKASMHRIDAFKHFDAAVDACLFIIQMGRGPVSHDCLEFESLSSQTPATRLGFREGRLVANIECYERWNQLRATSIGGWRSGIKHDCSKIFELERTGVDYFNGFNEAVHVEPSNLYPLLKSSDLAAHRQPRRWLLIPQRSMSDNPVRLKHECPKAWNYLMRHADLLDKRGSSIYKNRPRFSIFGIGTYSFAPWKVAISGFYKKLEFSALGLFENNPILLDDTCYFYSCRTKEECDLLEKLVKSDPAQEFLSAFIFWDSKRPVTANLLNSLDLAKLGRLLGYHGAMFCSMTDRQVVPYDHEAQQMLLFRETPKPYLPKRHREKA